MSEGHNNASASSSSSLSFNGSIEDTEDDHTIAIILAEEENLKHENKLGKRLSHLDSIPHTPRVNGEIPHVDDVTLNHELLSERLVTYGLAELKMEGDGNCQFRALADQLFHNPDYHKHVRKKTVKQIASDRLLFFLPEVVGNNPNIELLKRFRKLYEGYVPMKYKTYLKRMKKSGEWGDHLTLQAAADHFGAKICLITSFRDTCYIEILPKDENPSRELWLSFWSEVHYNSLYGIGEVPTRTPRKRHWPF